MRPFLAKAMIKQAYHCSFGLTKTFIFYFKGKVKDFLSFP